MMNHISITLQLTDILPANGKYEILKQYITEIVQEIERKGYVVSEAHVVKGERYAAKPVFIPTIWTVPMANNIPNKPINWFKPNQVPDWSELTTVRPLEYSLIPGPTYTTQYPPCDTEIGA